MFAEEFDRRIWLHSSKSRLHCGRFLVVELDLNAQLVWQ